MYRVFMAPTFSAESLEGDLAAGQFPEIRFAMLEFVGQYLLDFESAAQSLGLTLAQARVLGFAAVEASSQRKIAEQFGCDPSNISSKVDRLIELGLVERQPDPSDGRVKLVVATPEGVALSARLCHSREWLAEVLGDLDDSQVEIIRTALELLMGPRTVRV